MAYDETIYTPEEVRSVKNTYYTKYREQYIADIQKIIAKITFWCKTASQVNKDYSDFFLGVYTNDKNQQKDIKEELKKLGYKVSVIWWMNPIKQDWIRIRW